jgi:carbohydrate-selective porin OprB
MRAKIRLELGALSALAAMTCGAPTASGQTVAGDGGARPVIFTVSYTGELVQNAAGGARQGATLPGVAGVQLTLLLRRLVGWQGARIFVFALGTPSRAICRILSVRERVLRQHGGFVAFKGLKGGAVSEVGAVGS